MWRMEKLGVAMSICFLSDQTQDRHDLKVIAQWLHGQWGGITGSTLDAFLGGLQNRAGSTCVPFTLVAFEGIVPVGTASVVEQDMDTHPHLTPWLACVYVSADSRQKGIGSRLCEAAFSRTGELGIDRLYLFTPDRMRFYTRLGWSSMQQVSYRGEQVSIMAKRVSPRGPSRAV